MGHYHVAAPPDGLVHDGRRAVQRNQHAGDFLLRVAALQSGIVVGFLVGEGRGGFQRAGKVLNGRHFSQLKIEN